MFLPKLSEREGRDRSQNVTKSKNSTTTSKEIRPERRGDLPLGETLLVDLKATNMNQCPALEAGGFAL